MPHLGFELDFDELVAIILAVICTVSVLLTILQPIFAWFLRHSCLHAVLLQMDVYTELRAEQAALARARKPKVSKYGAEEAAKLTSVEVVPTRTTPTKMTAIAAKAAKASPSPEKASAEKKKDSKPMTVQERRAARATALHGEAAGKVAGNAHELLVAEAGADKAKTFDQKTGMAVMGAPRQPAKQPRAGVRGRGRATLVYPGDGVYEGEYKDGLKDGKGRFFYVVGSVYDGQWKEDQKHGEGKETYADGAVYDGLFVAGTRHGRGTLQYANSDSYEGEWSLDMKHGTGTFRWGAGTVYEGDFREGVMHGSGTYYFADGCVSATLRRAAQLTAQHACVSWTALLVLRAASVGCARTLFLSRVSCRACPCGLRTFPLLVCCRHLLLPVPAAVYRRTKASTQTASGTAAASTDSSTAQFSRASTTKASWRGAAPLHLQTARRRSAGGKTAGQLARRHASRPITSTRGGLWMGTSLGRCVLSAARVLSSRHARLGGSHTHTHTHTHTHCASELPELLLPYTSSTRSLCMQRMHSVRQARLLSPTKPHVLRSPWTLPTSLGGWPSSQSRGSVQPHSHARCVNASPRWSLSRCVTWRWLR